MTDWNKPVGHDVCRCKANPPRCPNAGNACFCTGVCQPAMTCPLHGYDPKDFKVIN